MKIKLWMATDKNGTTWLCPSKMRKSKNVDMWVDSSTDGYCLFPFGENVDGQTWKDGQRQVTLDTKRVK